MIRMLIKIIGINEVNSIKGRKYTALGTLILFYI
jgi:hypothetical protein